MRTKTVQATRAQAEKVVDELMRVFNQEKWGWERPRIMVDEWEDGRTVFVWDGPPEWTYVFPYGGTIGRDVKVPEAKLPPGVWTEPYNLGVVSVYYERPIRRS